MRFSIVFCMALMCSPALVFGESSSQFAGAASINPTLAEDTNLFVDIQGPGEVISYEGVDYVTCLDPNGNPLEGIQSGMGLVWNTNDAGTHKLVLESSQPYWTVTVNQVDGTPAQGARVWSDSWHLRSRIGKEHSFQTTLFAKLEFDVVEIQLSTIDTADTFLFSPKEHTTERFGLGSVTYDLLGLSANAGVLQANALINPVYKEQPDGVNPLYLNEIRPDRDLPRVNVDSLVVQRGPNDSCPALVADSSSGVLLLRSAKEGFYRAECTNGEQIFTLEGYASARLNTIAWPEGTVEGVYTCSFVTKRTPLHLPLNNVGTALPGIRMFRVLMNGDRVPMTMHWDDKAVPGAHDLISITAPTSPFWGVNSTDDSDAVAYTTAGIGNSRAWGSHVDDTPARRAVMWTTAYVDTSEIAQVSVQVLLNDSLADEYCAQFVPSDLDEDGIPDDEDNCPEVSNEDQLDTDENGVGDACEETEPDPNPDPDPVPDPDPNESRFEATAEGGSCATTGFGPVNSVLLSLLVLVGFVRRRLR